MEKKKQKISVVENLVDYEIYKLNQLTQIG